MIDAGAFGRLDLHTGALLAGAAVYAVAGALALLRGRMRRAAKWALFFFALFSIIWNAALGLERLGVLNFLSQAVLSRLPDWGLLCLTILFFWLTFAFLPRPALAWPWGMLTAFWIAGLVILDLNPFRLADVLWSSPTHYLPRQVLASVALLGGWAVWLGAATILSLRSYRQARRLLHRNRIAYWGLVLGPLALGDALFWLGETLPGVLIRLCAILLAFYVVTSARLPNTRQATRQVLAYGISTLLTLLVYLGAVLLALSLWGSMPGLSLVVLALGLAVFLVLLANPLLYQARRLVQRLVAGIQQDELRLLRQYSQDISNVLDLQLLARRAMETIAEVLDIEFGYLFLVNQEQESESNKIYRLHGVCGLGDAEPPQVAIGAESPLVNWWLVEHRPLTQSQVDFEARFQPLPLDERAWLETLGAEVYLPVFAREDWIGLLALGPLAGGAPFWDENLDFLGTIAGQTAMALENVRLVEGLMRLNGEFRRAYTALDLANRRLERLDRTKSDFINIASHELRTPLTLISASSQMLLEEDALQQNPYARQLLETIHKGANRLHQVIESMLDVAQIDARELRLDTQPLSLNALVELAALDLRQVFSGRKQTFEIQDLRSLPAVEADRQALRKVIYHLLANASKYSPDGGRISVSGRKLEADENWPSGGIEIVVSDTGIGVDPELYDLIFLKFYQTGELGLHSSGIAKFKGGGPGLGLAIARGIVEAHGGKIWVESPDFHEKEFPGSHFYVQMPVRQKVADGEQDETLQIR